MAKPTDTAVVDIPQRKRRKMPIRNYGIGMCSICQGEFQRKSSRAANCPDCRKEYDRVYKKRNEEKIKAKRKAEYAANRDAHSARSRQNYLRDKEKYIERARARRERLKETSPDSLRQYNRERMANWRKVNIEKARKSRRESVAKRRATDPIYALNGRIGNAIRNSLKNGKSSRSWERLIDYSLDDLAKHIERQFLPGMSWENMRKWHVDHILPLASFHYETPDDPEFKAAWAITNLQPLWKEDNLSKGAKVLTII